MPSAAGHRLTGHRGRLAAAVGDLGAADPWAGERDYTTLAADSSAATLFGDRYGIADHCNVDLTDDEAIRRDLSAPLGRGGTCIGLLPVAWWKHGFFNLNPRLITVLPREGELRPRAKLWAMPGRTIYCCYRKVGDAPFVVPSDVFGNW